MPDGTQLQYANSMGFTFEVAAVCAALRAGKDECAEMTSEESLQIMDILDECRKQLGVVYPSER